MKQVTDGLEPRLLWRHFHALSQIPRCSKQEEQVRAYILEMARQCKREYHVDETGNVVVTVPATKGREKAPVVILQSHLDMVCEKNTDTAHDFAIEGLRLRKDGDWISAEGTTLGADNGVGVAAALAVLESGDIAHGPLELLFTVDEETGLTGAMELEPGLLQGRMMINMDSEEDGALYIGCAGGKDTSLSLDIDWEPPPSGLCASIGLGGLQGGHSGIDIHRGRANAVRQLARFLWSHADALDLRVARMDGGNKHNAIPRECEAMVCLPDENMSPLKKAVSQFALSLKEEYGVIEPGLFFHVEAKSKEMPAHVFTVAFQERLLNLVYGLPNGVVAMSHAVAGLVQTSTNLAIVKTDGSQMQVVTSQRSAIPSQLTDIADTVCALGKQAGAQIHQGGGYPGWQPRLDSPLLKKAQEAFVSLYGHKPEMKTIHAGLECGIIGDKFPGMDMISFGPTIEGAHSPSERVQISAVEKFWDLLLALLAS